jgi:hypothetical protein
MTSTSKRTSSRPTMRKRHSRVHAYHQPRLRRYFLPPNHALGHGLPEPSKDIVLPPGMYQLPFEFIIPLGLPPSAELPVADWGFIRHSIYASIDLANWKDPSTRCMITVLASDTFPPPEFLAPAVTDRAAQTIFCCGCLGLGKQGQAQLQFSIDRRAYGPGEFMFLSIFAQNDTAEPGVALEVAVTQVVPAAADCARARPCLCRRQVQTGADSLRRAWRWLRRSSGCRRPAARSDRCLFGTSSHACRLRRGVPLRHAAARPALLASPPCPGPSRFKAYAHTPARAPALLASIGPAQTCRG